jgi:hypothetical protein
MEGDSADGAGSSEKENLKFNISNFKQCGEMVKFRMRDLKQADEKYRAGAQRREKVENERK